MLEDPKFWVGMAFLGFVAFAFYFKLPAMLLRALDARTDKIKMELGAARSLREEAEKVLAGYKQKQAEYLKEAEAMLAQARQDADALRAQAEKDLKTTLEARTKSALDRIAQEEDKAIQDVRNHVVDIALAAARAIIMDHAGGATQDELMKLALADIERKIH